MVTREKNVQKEWNERGVDVLSKESWQCQPRRRSRGVRTGAMMGAKPHGAHAEKRPPQIVPESSWRGSAFSNLV